VVVLFDATPPRTNFLMAVAFSKRVWRLIRTKNKITQLYLQIELAEEKSQSLHSQKSFLGTQQMFVTKEKNHYFECFTKVLCAGPKHFDKLKPESGPTRKDRSTYNSDPESSLNPIFVFEVRIRTESQITELFNMRNCRILLA